MVVNCIDSWSLSPIYFNVTSSQSDADTGTYDIYYLDVNGLATESLVCRRHSTEQGIKLKQKTYGL